MSVSSNDASTTLNVEWSRVLRGRRVLLTGHTGFKGGWLALWLARLGAQVTGYSLAPTPGPTLFASAEIDSVVCHEEGDVRDIEHLGRVWNDVQPEVAFHLAAQPIVRDSYSDPLKTVTTNTLGTVHVLELARLSARPMAVVLITSDKCYENLELERGYVEHDQLGGRDVYSGSKAAAEILINSYRRSFMNGEFRVASARAGNVIGGGDWALDRIVPDAIRALLGSRIIEVRNPISVRPWQHVLEPLSGYLTLACRLLNEDPRIRAQAADSWNFGPTIDNTRTVGELATALVSHWGTGSWIDRSRPNPPHEAGLLRLDITKAGKHLGWRPRWNFDEAVGRTTEWYKANESGANMRLFCEDQISLYERSSRCGSSNADSSAIAT